MFSGRCRLILPYRISVSIRFVEVKDGLCGAHDADDGVLEGQATLQVDVVGCAQRAVGTELDGSALHESACRHNDLVGVARHVPWLRRGEGIDRRILLDAAAEGDELVGAAELDGLDDVAAHVRRQWQRLVAELGEHARCEDRALDGL